MEETILIRHGESQYNAALTNSLDSELTEKGIQQVKKTGEFLMENMPEISSFIGFTSPYIRCLQTSKILNETTGIKFNVLQDPREVMLKYQPIKIINRNHIFTDFNWHFKDYWQENEWLFPTETVQQFLARIYNFVQNNKEDKSLIVSHGTPINAYYDLKLGIDHIPSTQNYVDNSSITHIKNNKGLCLGKIAY